MAIAGQTVLAALRRSYDQLVETASDVDQDRTNLENKLRDLLSGLDQAFTQLATVYLPQLSEPAIEGTFSEIRNELRAILLEQKQAEAEIRRQHDELQHRQEALRGQLDTITV